MEYVFIRIPRTASTSICKILNNYPNHQTALKLKEEFGDEWEKRFKFTIIRNPYDRFVSMYKQFSDVPFEKFISDKMFQNDIRYIPQVNYLYIGGKLAVDFVGRFENIDNSWNIICENIGIDKVEPPHLKESKGKIDLTEDVKKIIYEYYKKDFEMLDYN